MTLALLVIQPTPFCNIDCDYCYLPTRNDKSRMHMETLRAALQWVFAGGLIGEDLSIVWHAGEPLVLSPDYYRQAFAVINELCPPEVTVRHSIQTNGTLIDDGWCELIRGAEINVGLSVDGPAWLHDQHRRTRSGRGTHDAVMRGLKKLQAHDIPVHAICLLTRESLRHADGLFDFFIGCGIRDVGFNIEEIEAAHDRSSLNAPGVEGEFRAFFLRLMERLRAAPGLLHIREVDDVLRALRHPQFGKLGSNCQNTPFELVSISWDGQIGTFSPELLGTRHPAYGSFTLGSVFTDRLADIIEGPRYRRIADDLAAGLAACRRECTYFPFCRGGAPANKLAENGSFASTETLYCRLTQKLVIECVLHALERDLMRTGERQAPLWASITEPAAPAS